ncbi:MAG TPA: alkaline phosphatase family protein [Aliidongia sp.]|uniref:phospholipase C n=1 Tax=Aliidongia sp. TaxID=1914230 RepID=UPI002DDDADEE|nr:alkaline phosphatase family protein [Aliidongia sp.]HEV2673310.1 alkaline phosphatase family protein [Aliidongia sp.]
MKSTKIMRTALACTLMAATSLTTILAPLQAFAASSTGTVTPIQHVVVLFQENVSFDHYFGTYPNAANNAGETSYAGVAAPAFTPKTNTPTVNGLTPALLTQNPNKDTSGNQANPFRFLPSQAYTCSMNHSYGPEQAAADKGLMDQYPQNNAGRGNGCDPAGSTVMGYYDGNLVTAYWNYAQHYALSDNNYGTNFGPSSPGAINLIAGNTYGGQLPLGTSSGSAFDPTGTTTETDVSLLNDLDAYLDDCGGDKGGSVHTATLQMTGKNIGDLLNAQNVTWGWFQGGFAPTTAATFDGQGNVVTPAVCAASHTGHQVVVSGTTYTVPEPTINHTGEIHTAVTDYSSHHAPFMYYASTRNPHHLRPTSVAAIGTTDQANHNYDTSDFFASLANGTLPAVSFIKAPAYQDGHPGNSDPLVEQAWIASAINAIQQSSSWASTAIVIAYDDSDGWYDHAVPSNVRQSTIAGQDALTGSGACGPAATGGVQGRCGFGPRLPMIVVSPYAKTNYVDHTLTDQSSIIAFVEKNWGLGFIDGPTPPTYGSGSTDRYAGAIDGMFDFVDAPNTRQLQLDPVKGTIVGRAW